MRRPTGDDLRALALPRGRRRATRRCALMLDALVIDGTVGADDEAALARRHCRADPLVDFRVACACPACGARQTRWRSTSKRWRLRRLRRAAARAAARGAPPGVALRLDRSRGAGGAAVAPRALSRADRGRAMSDYFDALMRIELAAGDAPAARRRDRRPLEPDIDARRATAERARRRARRAPTVPSAPAGAAAAATIGRRRHRRGRDRADEPRARSAPRDASRARDGDAARRPRSAAGQRVDSNAADAAGQPTSRQRRRQRSNRREASSRDDRCARR